MKINIKGKFVKSLAVLTSGSIIAQIIILIQQPLLTRIFSPEAIGIYTYLLAIPLMFISVINARYDMAIVTEEDENNIFPLIKLSIIVTLIMSTIVTIIYVIYIAVVSPEYIKYLYTTPIIFLLLIALGVVNTLNSYNNREARYKLMSSVYVTRTAVQCGGVIILGFIFVKVMKFTNLSVLILMLPYCIGLYAGIRKQGKQIIPNLKQIMSCTKEDVLKVAKKHKKQPLLSAPALLANGFSYSAITIFIETLYDSASLGFYSMSTRVLGMPLALISTNVSKVFLEQASKEYEKTDSYKKSFNRTIMFLIPLSILMVLCMYFFAPPICRWMFGEGWDIAGEYIQILSIMFGIRFVATALSPGLLVCKKQEYELFSQLFLAFSSLLCGIVSSFLNVPITTFLTFICILNSIGYGLNIFLVYTYSKKR